MTECPHGFSDPAWCEDCTPRSKPEPVGPIHIEAIPAQYPGRCAECKEEIKVGDMIVPDLRFGWDHDECV